MKLSRLATVLSVLGASLVVVQAPVQAAGPIDASQFQLTEGGTSAGFNELVGKLPRASIGTVVGSANRQGSTCSPPTGGGVNLPNDSTTYCWNADDNDGTDWKPQGISTSADMYDAGTVEGYEIILAAWYKGSHPTEQGLRVSFFNPANKKYRHALLVEPYVDGGGANFRNVTSVHGGGIAWYGNYLYVADTYTGLRVFDMGNIWKVQTGDTSKVGRYSDGYHAGNYAYAIPQLYRYARGGTTLTYSTVSLDRTSTPDSLLVAEYSATAADNGTRIVRFNIDYTTRRLIKDGDNLVRGDAAYQTGVQSVQGAVSVNNVVYMFTSDANGNTVASNGDIVRFIPDSTLKIYYNSLPVGIQAISYWDTQDHLWSQTEFAGRRSIVSIKYSAYKP